MVNNVWSKDKQRVEFHGHPLPFFLQPAVLLRIVLMKSKSSHAFCTGGQGNVGSQPFTDFISASDLLLIFPKKYP
jgi:hypothetical protein